MVTITRKKTHRDGTQTEIKYTKRGVTRTKRSKSGNVLSKKENLSMKEHREESKNESRRAQLDALGEVGATGEWKDGKLHIVDAQGKKYRTDSLWGNTWRDLREAFGLSPTRDRGLGGMRGYDDGSGIAGAQPPPGGGSQPPPGGTQPPPGDDPDDPIQNLPPNPRPDPPGGPEFPDIVSDHPFPVFGGENRRDPKELYDEWFSNQGQDLLRGYGPNARGPRDFSLTREEYDEMYPAEPAAPPPAEPQEPDEPDVGEYDDIGDLFPGGFNPQTDWDSLVDMVGQEEAMRLIQEWFQNQGPQIPQNT